MTLDRIAPEPPIPVDQTSVSRGANSSRPEPPQVVA